MMMMMFCPENQKETYLHPISSDSVELPYLPLIDKENIFLTENDFLSWDGLMVYWLVGGQMALARTPRSSLRKMLLLSN